MFSGEPCVCRVHVAPESVLCVVGEAHFDAAPFLKRQVLWEVTLVMTHAGRKHTVAAFQVQS